MVCLSSAKLQMERWRQIVTGMIGSGGGTCCTDCSCSTACIACASIRVSRLPSLTLPLLPQCQFSLCFFFFVFFLLSFSLFILYISFLLLKLRPSFLVYVHNAHTVHTQGTGRESSEVLFAPANTLSKIYSALAGAYSRLAAKSSIYFYQPLQPSLSNVSSAPGSAQRLARVTDLSSFQRKVGACMVSVHRSAANHARTGCLRLDGYCHPAAPAEPLAGLKSFPALISIPFDEGVPMNHMVTIYSLAADEIDRLAANDVVVFDESEFRATRRAPEKFAYYLARVDTLATLVVVFHLKGKKGVDKEQNTTTREFIIEFRKNMGKIWQSGI